jgi:type VI secretion system protein ImpH
MTAALAGIGLPGQNEGELALATEAIMLAHARALSWEVRGPERIEAPVADLLAAPVRLVEFVASWIEIPPQLRTRIGQPMAILGQGAVVGERIFSRQDRVELRVGPLDLANYLALSVDGPLRARLRYLLLHIAGREVDIDLRLVLDQAEVPEPRIGQVALGRTVWLPSRRPADRDDLRLSRITREAA